jgi:hypothetical protein
MGWLSKIFSSVGVNVISSVGKVVDDLITSDEELELTDIQKKKSLLRITLEFKSLCLQSISKLPPMKKTWRQS